MASDSLANSISDTTQTPTDVVPPPASRKQRNSIALAIRGLLEMLVLVLITWSLLRTFEVESFAIPTGSMAPTLQGNHYQVSCPECGIEFRVNASIENDGPVQVVTGSCPICRFPAPVKQQRTAARRFFAGDSIIVDKSSYRVSDPRRWDVAVFKNPQDPKINYIKRLVGLPNETIRIQYGDIYTLSAGSGDSHFRIARKPPAIARAMLQLVDDSQYQPQRLLDAGWPMRWQEWSSDDDRTRQWSYDESTNRFVVEALDSAAWLRYRHYVPRADDWGIVKQPGAEPRRPRPQLITDYFEYNDFQSLPADPNRSAYQGLHWVGDLAVECDVQIQSGSGYLLLELIEGGVHFRCQINVSSGHAELNHDVRWADGTSKHRAGKTPIQQPGKHKLLFANVDDQLLLWVDEELISFDGTTSYDRERDVIPKWTNDDPLDLAPVGVGSDGLALTVHRLRVLRDVYYLATTNESPPYDYDGYFTPDQIHDVFDNPFIWDHNTLFQARRMVEFESGQDEYFPLGDNSQYSQDARYWENAAVNRDFLIGRALLVYWPRGNGMLPDFERFRLIR